jgi:hypothetical protein
MTNLVQNLEQCWYTSPPWGQRIPPLLVSLLEQVYVKSAKAFGYCTGVEWSERNTARLRENRWWNKSQFVRVGFTRTKTLITN